MLRIGFLPVEKAVADKPRDKRETNGRGQQLSLPEHRLRAAETRAGHGALGLHLPPHTAPHRGSAIPGAHSRQLREPDGLFTCREMVDLTVGHVL